MTQGRLDFAQEPRARSISFSRTVARLSVITTESIKMRACLPCPEFNGKVTRLAWPARDMLLVIIATML